MRTNVKSYTDDQLLARVKSHAEGFTHFPTDYWCIGIQSNEDAFNEFDDKFYLFKGKKFIRVMSGTTNAGKQALKGYDKAGLAGAAVWKTDVIYYGVFAPGKHKGKMDAWRQVEPIYYYRDNNKDDKADQTGKLWFGIIYANFHTATYDKTSRAIKKLINGWSWACQVVNDPQKYYKTMRETFHQKRITYALLKEF